MADSIVIRIKNLNWPRYLVVVTSLGFTLNFLIFWGFMLRIMDAIGLDTEGGNQIFGHHLGRLEGLFEERSDLIAAAEAKG
jgi:hypothetical protein